MIYFLKRNEDCRSELVKECSSVLLNSWIMYKYYPDFIRLLWNCSLNLRTIWFKFKLEQEILDIQTNRLGSSITDLESPNILKDFVFSSVQLHLTEELHTVENGYHDNPTLEVMEVQPEMQEKKMALNGEFSDSWIVPIDNLMKEDAPDEEDTHLWGRGGWTRVPPTPTPHRWCLKQWQNLTYWIKLKNFTKSITVYDISPKICHGWHSAPPAHPAGISVSLWQTIMPFENQLECLLRELEIC